MAKRTNHSIEQRDGYVRRLARYLRECAECKHREERWDVFLWSARCAFESICRAILVVEEPQFDFDSRKNTDLLKVLSAKKLIPEDVMVSLRSVKQQGNLGAHVQGSEPPSYGVGVDSCSTGLPVIIRWYFERYHEGEPVPGDIDDSLHALSSKEPHLSRDEQTIREQATTIEELERELAELRKIYDERRESFDELRRRVSMLEAFESEEGERPSSRWSRKRTILMTATVSVVLFLVGVASGGLSVWGLLAAERSRQGVASFESSRAVVERSGAAASDASVAVSSDLAADASTGGDEAGSSTGGESSLDAARAEAGAVDASVSCPDGMLAISAGDIRVVQPRPRKSWPPPRREIRETHVPAFCIERRPVTISAFRRCTQRGHCQPELMKQVRTQRPESQVPMTSVDWSSADGYCRWQDSRLPTVLQFERSLEALPRRELVFGTEFEWVDDPFPARIFERGPVKRGSSGDVLERHMIKNRVICDGEDFPWSALLGKCQSTSYSWHRRRASKALMNLGFRCATAAL